MTNTTVPPNLERLIAVLDEVATGRLPVCERASQLGVERTTVWRWKKRLAELLAQAREVRDRLAAVLAEVYLSSRRLLTCARVSSDREAILRVLGGKGLPGTDSKGVVRLRLKFQGAVCLAARLMSIAGQLHDLADRLAPPADEVGEAYADLQATLEELRDLSSLAMPRIDRAVVLLEMVADSSSKDV